MGVLLRSRALSEGPDTNDRSQSYFKGFCEEGVSEMADTIVIAPRFSAVYFDEKVSEGPDKSRSRFRRRGSVVKRSPRISHFVSLLLPSGTNLVSGAAWRRTLELPQPSGKLFR